MSATRSAQVSGPGVSVMARLRTSPPSSAPRQRSSTRRRPVRCCAASPGLARPARMLDTVMGRPVMADSAEELRRIWPPPSSMAPAHESAVCMRQRVQWCGHCSTPLGAAAARAAPVAAAGSSLALQLPALPLLLLLLCCCCCPSVFLAHHRSAASPSAASLRAKWRRSTPMREVRNALRRRRCSSPVAGSPHPRAADPMLRTRATAAAAAAAAASSPHSCSSTWLFPAQHLALLARLHARRAWPSEL